MRDSTLIAISVGAVILAIVVLLSGCADPTTKLECSLPPLVAYSPEDQERLATELERAPDDCTWCRFIADYGALRDAIRKGQQ